MTADFESAATGGRGFIRGRPTNCARQPDIVGGAIKAPVLKYDGVRAD
jgi:hypothetical protein